MPWENHLSSTKMAADLGKIHVPVQPLEESLAKLTVPELQQRLKKRGLKKSGVKIKLIQRLKEAIELEQAEEEKDAADQEIDETNDTVGSGTAEETPADVTTSTKEPAILHDPYTEFESSIPGVAEGEGREKVNQRETVVDNEDIEIGKEENVQAATTSEANAQGQHFEAEMNDATATQGLSDQKTTNQQSEHQELKGGATGDTGSKDQASENQVSEDQGFCSMSPNNARSMDSNYEEGEDHQGEKFKIEDKDKKEEAEGEIGEEQVEEGCKTGDFETVQDREVEPKEEAENTDDGKREQEEHKEVGIEINVEKGEKDEFNDQEEGEQEKLSEIKQGIKTKKKQITPVQLKKRRNVSEDFSGKQESPVPRKRRWGSSASKESLTISSDSLKGLIPNVSVIPNEDPLGLALDYGEVEEGEIDEEAHADVQMEESSDMKESHETHGAEERSLRKEVRRGRTVKISTNDTVKLTRMEAEENEDMKHENENEMKMEITAFPAEKVSLLPQVSTEDPEFVRERSASPPKNDQSNVLIIRNLVRPFTLRQLREFLGKFGTIAEDGFWIDRIKSHCYVTYESVDEAVTSRSAIHGTRWPIANPKVLSADFAVNEEMYKETEGKLGKPPLSFKTEEVKAVNDRDNEELRKRDQSAEKSKRDAVHDVEIKVEETAKPKEKKEVPGRLLDDLYRKTKALPCIYWLPLTKEQVAAKEKEREKHQADIQKSNEEAIARETREREERRKKREMEAERERGSPKGQFDGRSGRQYRERRRSRSSSMKRDRKTN